MKCKNCKNLIDHWCEKVIDSPDEEMDRECKHYEVMSNADRIKNMSVEEMATFLLDVTDCCVTKDCDICILGKDNIAYCNTKLTMTEWLESEAKDNG